MIEAELAELEQLRSENELLRSQLQATEAECRALHSIVASRAHDGAGASSRRGSVTRVEIGSRERMAMLEHTVDVLEAFVTWRAQYDCYGCEYGDGPPGNDGQKCERCAAEAALLRVRAWRYGGSAELPSRRFEGAMYRRIVAGWDPRETKIHRAWAEFMPGYSSNPDRLLALVLTDRSVGTSVFEPPLDWPTPRDWYVATSVVQWLATTVGSTILEKAGWKYTQHDEDRGTIEAKRAATGSPLAPVVTVKQEERNADHR